MELPGIRFQVADHLQARRVARVLLGKRGEGELGVFFVGMQVEPLVMPMPCDAHLIGLLQDETGDTGLLETSPNGQPGWPCAHDDRMARSQIRDRELLKLSGHSRISTLCLGTSCHYWCPFEVGVAPKVMTPPHEGSCRCRWQKPRRQVLCSTVMTTFPRVCPSLRYRMPSGVSLSV